MTRSSPPRSSIDTAKTENEQPRKRRRYRHVWLSLLCVLLAACKASADRPGSDSSTGTLTAPQSLRAVQPDIRVAYPAHGTLIAASSTYIAGAVPPGKQLLCNGEPVKTHAKGYFAQIVPL